MQKYVTFRIISHAKLQLLITIPLLGHLSEYIYSNLQEFPRKPLIPDVEHCQAYVHQSSGQEAWTPVNLQIVSVSTEIR